MGVVVAALLLILSVWPNAVAFWLSGPAGVAASITGYKARDTAQGKTGLVPGLIAAFAFISLLVGTGTFPPEP